MSIDPTDAGTVVDIAVEDLFGGPCQCPKQVVVVRVLRKLRRRVDVLEAEGHRVRLADVNGVRPRHQLASEFVTFAATYSRYEATRITGSLSGAFLERKPVRVSTVRALMKSVRLPEVKETTQFEEVL